MSSPRGFVAGGMVWMGRVADADLGRIPDEGEDERDDDEDDEWLGRGKKNDKGFQ